MEPLESNPDPATVLCKDCLTPVEFSEAWYCAYCETVGLCPTCGNRHDHECKPSTIAANQLEDDMSKKTFQPKVPKALIEKRKAAINKRNQERGTAIVGQVASCAVLRIPAWAATKLGIAAGDVMRISVLGKQLHVAHTAREEERKKIRAQRAKELAERRANKGKGKKRVTKVKTTPKPTTKPKPAPKKKAVLKPKAKTAPKPKPTPAKVTKLVPKKKAVKKATKASTLTPKVVQKAIPELLPEEGNIYTPPAKIDAAE